MSALSRQSEATAEGQVRVVGKTSTIRWRKFYLAAARFGRRFQTKPILSPPARTGAKGQRPPQGRAGAGLASHAGTGAGAGPIQWRNDSRPSTGGAVADRKSVV